MGTQYYMNTSNSVWLIVAVVVAVLVIAALVFAASRASRSRRQRQAEQIREQAKLETAKLERREALAGETAAKARAAQAEAEVKAAEAARLQERAAKHQSEVAASREQLQERFDHADNIDPKVRRDARETEEASREASRRDEADESYPQTTDTEGVGPDHRDHRAAST